LGEGAILVEFHCRGSGTQYEAQSEQRASNDPVLIIAHQRLTPTPRGLLKLAICVYTQIDDLTQAGVPPTSQFLHGGTTEKT
jgi:hypothetical protein